MRVPSPTGIEVSYDKYGTGPALVLVHGGFSDHQTNWEFVKPLLESQFTVHAIARRGRGETPATQGHSLEDEGRDVAAVIAAVGNPVFLLGHSYGAHAALLAAAEIPTQVRKLVLYEPPSPNLIEESSLAKLETLADRGAWADMAATFFHELLLVPTDEILALRASPLWPPIVADSKASLGDIRAVCRYRFQPDRFRNLTMPVCLQIGSESPRELYATDSLAEVLPNAQIQSLTGQAHEGMTTAPDMYAQKVKQFLLN
jgi:pimeloyl-ACP methyl ester carboxylesterase